MVARLLATATGPDTRSKLTGRPAVLFVLEKVRTLPKGTLLIGTKEMMLWPAFTVVNRLVSGFAAL